jgi:hypothetical protein
MYHWHLNLGLISYLPTSSAPIVGFALPDSPLSHQNCHEHACGPRYGRRLRPTKHFSKCSIAYDIVSRTQWWEATKKASILFRCAGNAHAYYAKGRGFEIRLWIDDIVRISWCFRRPRMRNVPEIAAKCACKISPIPSIPSLSSKPGESDLGI